MSPFCVVAVACPVFPVDGPCSSKPHVLIFLPQKRQPHESGVPSFEAHCGLVCLQTRRYPGGATQGTTPPCLPWGRRDSVGQPTYRKLTVRQCPDQRSLTVGRARSLDLQSNPGHFWILEQGYKMAL